MTEAQNQNPQPQPKPQRVERTATTRVYDGYLKVDRHRLRYEKYEGGMSAEIEREVIERGAVAVVLPLDPVARKVVLIEQFRPGPMSTDQASWMVECVAGVLEPHESPEQLARREAREEAGLEILDLEPVHRFFSSPGMSSEVATMFCGRVDSRNAGGIHGLEDEGENIRVLVFTIDDAIALLERGAVTNGFTIIALQWLALHHERMIAQWCGAQ